MKISKSKKKILDAAKDLFWKFGLRKISVEDICSTAEISKMTFYRHFENKIDVAKILLQQFIDEGMDAYFEIMKMEIPYPQKIKLLIELKHKRSEGLSFEFIKDIYQKTDSGLFEIFERYTSDALKTLENDLLEAQKQGWVRQDLKVSFIIYMLNTMNVKMQDPAFLAFFETPDEAITELTNFFFYGIMSNE